MNAFVAVFYSSLAFTTVVVGLQYRAIRQRRPEVFLAAQKERRWFLLDIARAERYAKRWFERAIKPTLIATSLRILKIAQSRLQSMRDWVRLQARRLSDMQMRHQQHKNLTQSRNL